jgi:hypothetical protein
VLDLLALRAPAPHDLVDAIMTISMMQTWDARLNKACKIVALQN